MDTIFALSSGAPPAAIAVVRISGPDTAGALKALCGRLPQPRRAQLAMLRREDGAVLDESLVLWFPGPSSATGDDLGELHLHGGRAVVAAVEAALAKMRGLRRAEAGEFTRRAFANGRIDLAQAEGLADLLEAETELQRAAAVSAAGGALSRKVDGWRDRVLMLSAQVEAALDFSDDDDVDDVPPTFAKALGALTDDIERALDTPASEKLREGYRVALAGPPNAGKSTLFNALVGSDAAIATPLPGTTRDVLERSVAIEGVPFSFVDMAGIHDEAADPVERIGIERAAAEIERADLVLWLGTEGEGPKRCWEVDAQIDRSDWRRKVQPDYRVSAVTGEGLYQLTADLVVRARSALPKPGEVALSRRQRMALRDAHAALEEALLDNDLLLQAEHLRSARLCFDRLLGRAGVEDVLDTLFGRFCIGK